jgi:DNA modification methylase
MQASDVRLLTGDCIEQMRTLDSGSIDAIITDPPYPEINRPYGRMTEAAWHELMRGVVAEAKRVLKPHGSAVFILQPNSETAGRMRPWLWEFMTFICREWNMVQDAWWWNFAAIPAFPCQRQYGLMRPSLKACVWAGPSDCFRNQEAVLWSPSVAALGMDRSDRMLRRHPSGHSTRPGRIAEIVAERGGVTPFNLLPVAGNSAGTKGHPAATPLDLCRWWIRYLTPEKGVVLDCFSGSGTMGVAALAEGRGYVGVERDEHYMKIAQERLSAAAAEEAADEPVAA